MQKSQKRTIKTDKAYFITLTVVNWIDVFSRKNPVESGFVNEPQVWLYSSAKNYYGLEGI